MKIEARISRNKEIHNLVHGQGMSVAEVARAKKLSEKQVSRIIKGFEPRDLGVRFTDEGEAQS